MKYKRGIFIGRFQPFHKGHLEVLKLMQKECKQIVIGIGSAQLKQESRNPLSSKQRRTILRTVVSTRKIPAKIIKVVDVPDDKDWMQMLLKTKFDVIYSSNLWVLKIARTVKRELHATFSIIDVKPQVDNDETRDISATRVRKSIREGTVQWEKLVPPEVKKCIQKKYLGNF
jgi:nicotinamide-nucleotide adenylyltransferase